jgi:hypothetical protein
MPPRSKPLFTAQNPIDVGPPEDPTVLTRPWTAKQEFYQARRAGEQTLLQMRPFPSTQRGLEERAVVEGRGPDPATKDAMKAGFISFSE